MTKRYLHFRNKTDLIDMEVAQFYHFCRTFGRRSVQFIAIKGAANVLGSGKEQVVNSQKVLKECAKLGYRLLLDASDLSAERRG
jgi:hypothetical protein